MTIYDFYVYNVLIYPMYEYLYNIHYIVYLVRFRMELIEALSSMRYLINIFSKPSLKKAQKKTPILSTLGCSIDFG